MEAAHQTPFRLFDLPQELQDVTFDFAYPRQDGLKIAFKTTWTASEDYERKSKGSSYQVRPFPTAKVDEWMVSKRYFLLAAKAWMSHQAFGDETGSNIPDVTDEFLSADNGLFFDFAREVIGVQTYYLKQLKNCKNLHTVNLRLTTDSFEGTVGSKLPWEELLDDFELGNLTILADIGALRGLQTFSLSRSSCRWAKTAEEQAIWEKNIEALEALTWPWVTAPKSEMKSTITSHADREASHADREANPCTPLYTGSTVCSHCSEILKTELQQLMEEVNGAFARATDAETKVKKVKKVPGRYAGRRLAESEIPKSDNELFEMMQREPKKVAAWIRGAQKKIRKPRKEVSLVKTPSGKWKINKT